MDLIAAALAGLLGSFLGTLLAPETLLLALIVGAAGTTKRRFWIAWAVASALVLALLAAGGFRSPDAFVLFPLALFFMGSLARAGFRRLAVWRDVDRTAAPGLDP